MPLSVQVQVLSVLVQVQEPVQELVQELALPVQELGLVWLQEQELEPGFAVAAVFPA